MENIFLQTRITLLEAMLLNSADQKLRYLTLLNDVKQDIILSSNGQNIQPLLEHLEQHCSNVLRIPNLES